MYGFWYAFWEPLKKCKFCCKTCKQILFWCGLNNGTVCASKVHWTWRNFCRTPHKSTWVVRSVSWVPRVSSPWNLRCCVSRRLRLDAGATWQKKPCWATRTRTWACPEEAAWKMAINWAGRAAVGSRITGCWGLPGNRQGAQEAQEGLPLGAAGDQQGPAGEAAADAGSWARGTGERSSRPCTSCEDAPTPGRAAAKRTERAGAPAAQRSGTRRTGGELPAPLRASSRPRCGVGGGGPWERRLREGCTPPCPSPAVSCCQQHLQNKITQLLMMFVFAVRRF